MTTSGDERWLANEILLSIDGKWESGFNVCERPGALVCHVKPSFEPRQ
jgi:hypothetical protein